LDDQGRARPARYPFGNMFRLRLGHFYVFGEVADERITSAAEVTHWILGLVKADNSEQLINAHFALRGQIEKGPRRWRASSGG